MIVIENEMIEKARRVNDRREGQGERGRERERERAKSGRERYRKRGGARDTEREG